MMQFLCLFVLVCAVALLQVQAKKYFGPDYDADINDIGDKYREPNYRVLTNNPVLAKTYNNHQQNVIATWVPPNKIKNPYFINKQKFAHLQQQQLQHTQPQLDAEKEQAVDVKQKGQEKSKKQKK